MRTCIVGSGPSGAQNAAAIDACDRVARLNLWRPGPAGRKWTAWYVFLESLELQKRIRAENLLDAAPPNLDVRVRRHARFDRGIGSVIVVSDRIVFDRNGKAPKSFPVRTYDGRWIRDWFVANARNHPAGPTIGIYALAEELAREPEALVAAGFDATTPADKATWGDWHGGRHVPFGPTVQQDHDYELEKRILDTWARVRVFCGRPFPKTAPTWLRHRAEGGKT